MLNSVLKLAFISTLISCQNPFSWKGVVLKCSNILVFTICSDPSQFSFFPLSFLKLAFKNEIASDLFSFPIQSIILHLSFVSKFAFYVPSISVRLIVRDFSVVVISVRINDPTMTNNLVLICNAFEQGIIWKIVGAFSVNFTPLK